jgi:hypothetical protein
VAKHSVFFLIIAFGTGSTILAFQSFQKFISESEVLQAVMRDLNILLEIECLVRSVSLADRFDSKSHLRSKVAYRIQSIQFLNH